MLFTQNLVLNLITSHMCSQVLIRHIQYNVVLQLHHLAYEHHYFCFLFDFVVDVDVMVMEVVVVAVVVNVMRRILIHLLLVFD